MAERGSPQSLRIQLNLLVALFLVLPVLLYSAFSVIDGDRRDLVLATIRDSGRLIGAALAPGLQSLPTSEFGTLPDAIARFGSEHRQVTLLFKPKLAPGGVGFFYVAAAPKVGDAAIAAERDHLYQLGVLDRLAASCAGDVPMAGLAPVPGTDLDLLTAVSPVQSPAGCWAVVVVSDEAGELSLAEEHAYWMRPSIAVALAVYAAMAGIACAVFLAVRRNVLRLREAADGVEQGSRFVDEVSVQEFEPMARAFDQMVGRLRQTAQTLRQAAEDNAHAMKGAVAVVRQLLEKLRGTGPAETIEGLDVALDRLDGLVRSARALDTATAELLEGDSHVVDLSALLDGFGREYQLMLGARARCLEMAVAPDVRVRGSEELFEVIVENLVENAIGFIAPDGTVRAALAREDTMAVLTVSDDGPGVEPALLGRIFDRYVSSRPETAEGEHYGIGLWLVRQNVAALGGTVSAQNRDAGGFEVVVRVPALI
jgi:two-component system sensor histidine kinase ChvG